MSEFGPGYNTLLQGPGYAGIRSMASGQGANPWARLAEFNQTQKSGRAQDELMENLGEAAANAESRMASGGGALGGARERLAQGNIWQALKGAQGLAGDQMEQAGDIAIRDQEMRNQAQAQQANMEQTDISNINNYNMAMWSKQKEVQAANELAKAQREAARKSKRWW